MADDPRKDTDEDDDSLPEGDEPKGKPVVEASDETEGEGDALPEPKNALARREEPSENADAADAGEATGEDDEEEVLPGQMGHRRYVYAAFFTFAICIAY